MSQHKNKINTQFVHSKFEQYSSKSKYDFLLFNHSMFTFTGFEYLEKARSLLKNNGFLVFIANDPNSFLGNIKKIIGTKRKEINNVIDDLQSCEFNISEYSINTQFPSLVDNEDITSNGKKVLEWMFMNDYDYINKQMLEQTIKIIKNQTIENKINEKEKIVIAIPTS